ncbi:MAG TPA: class I SAM-dependent methyltransferase [Acidimicrobiales bacterium]|nr:class I SAM-dependent methyltransferase [Acidimicrobiales bacterium]
MHQPQADPGSFRDPTSRVFVTDDSVWRGLSKDALADFEALAATEFFRTALERGELVGTQLATASAPALPGEWAGVLRHDRIRILSYPYEWPFAMLRDAARLQLSLARRALAEQLITKDASAYNIQFVGTRPVFIDIGSFERVHGGEPWPGYRQFCEHFLNPLLLQAMRDVPFHPVLRGSVHGIPPGMAADLLRGSRRRQRGVFTHVKLHARAERRYADADRERDVRSELKRAGFGPGLIDAQLKNLERAIEALRWPRHEKRTSSTWSSYTERSHYTDRDLQRKEAFVETAVAHAGSPRLVLDLGANDGRFSRLALGAGAGSVVAVDSDHLVVDRLYRDLTAEGEARVLPLVLDLSDPSPGLGWRSRERPAFVDRMRGELDLVLCLAVVHHLALTNTVPLDEIVEFLADLDAPVVVEFPHRDDVMAARLLARKRSGLFDGYDVPQWERALERRFQVSAREVLPSGTRTIYRAEPR